jgi:LysR family glycine cleavage system transcriptional activator
MTPMFWRRDLESGRLVQPFAPIYVSSRSHWLIYPEGRRNQPKIATFRDWLMNEVAEAEKEGPAAAFAPPA